MRSTIILTKHHKACTHNKWVHVHWIKVWIINNLLDELCDCSVPSWCQPTKALTSPACCISRAAKQVGVSHLSDQCFVHVWGCGGPQSGGRVTSRMQTLQSFVNTTIQMILHLARHKHTRTCTQIACAGK